MRSDFSLIDANGKRKYLVEAEREAFLSAANRLPPRERAFCLTLEATGGRISEVLALQKRHIDRAPGEISILCLKKRGETIYRRVPVSPALIAMLELVFDLGRGKGETILWQADVRTARRWIMKAMDSAKLNFGPHALRHTFGSRCVQKGLPLTSLQNMLGHADIKTTAIYAQVVGADLRKMMERMWE